VPQKYRKGTLKGVRYIPGLNKLLELAEDARTHDRNRQADLTVLKHMTRTLGQDETSRYPVPLALFHKHIAGKPAEPHMRLEIMISERGRVWLDVSMSLWEALPEDTGMGETVLLDEKVLIESAATRATSS
jgi:hypothetical protein